MLLKKQQQKLHYNRLFCCNHTCYCDCMVSVASSSRYATPASRYQSRSSSRSDSKAAPIWVISSSIKNFFKNSNEA